MIVYLPYIWKFDTLNPPKQLEACVLRSFKKFCKTTRENMKQDMPLSEIKLMYLDELRKDSFNVAHIDRLGLDYYNNIYEYNDSEKNSKTMDILFKVIKIVVNAKE